MFIYFIISVIRNYIEREKYFKSLYAEIEKQLL